jgi:RNA polymerase sigma factor (sigma-70 family)
MLSYYYIMAYQSDSYYLDRIKSSGDRYAFSALVNKHQTMVFNLALRVTRNREDAEEVAQDTFIKVFSTLSEFRGESKFTTWLYRISMNFALNKIRKKSLFDVSVDDEAFSEPATEIDFPLEVKERKDIIKKAIASLDNTDGMLITLFYMDDQSVEDISEITGLSPSNVKVRMFRARKKLQQYINKQLQEEIISV